MSFTLKQIRYFVAAAEAGQISRAAIELNVAQSAVTTAIRQLEELIGTNLLMRNSSGVTLTADGQQFLRHSRDILAGVDQALRFQRVGENQFAGRVRVGITYTVAGYFLPTLLARFRRIYPDVEIALEEHARADAEARVLSGDYDFALTMVQDIRDRNGLSYRTLHRSMRRLWLPANHPLLAAESVNLETIAREPYLALTVDGAWEYAKRYWAATPFRPNVVFETASVEGIRTMVASGLGVTILSDMIYRPWSLDGQRIEARDIDGGVPTVDVAVVTRADKSLDPAAHTLATFLHRNCNSVVLTLEPRTRQQ